jgi:DNA ligase-1
MMQPMLAKTYTGNESITGWLMSEKLDGVRAMWDGRRLVSRNRNPIDAPAIFLTGLPSIALDGELWLGRGKFQQTISALKSTTQDAITWHFMKFMVFDAPLAAGSFAVRLSIAADASKESRSAVLVPHVTCTGRDHLFAHAATLIAKGAEGVMLRDPRSRYEHKRSASLLKYKHTSTDDGVVIGHDGGTGRNAGVVGALVCAWRGIRFGVSAGLDDIRRNSPPKIGSIITFAYNGLTDAGVPRFPKFVAERNYE